MIKRTGGFSVGIAVIVVIVIIAVVWGINWGIVALNKPAGASDYVAVYMVNGDVYFGKLTWGSQPRLDNVWILNHAASGSFPSSSPSVNLLPFKSTFWTPIDEINLNPQAILFWAYVKDGTEFAKALQS